MNTFEQIVQDMRRTVCCTAIEELKQTGDFDKFIRFYNSKGEECTNSINFEDYEHHLKAKTGGEVSERDVWDQMVLASDAVHASHSVALTVNTYSAWMLLNVMTQEVEILPKPAEFLNVGYHCFPCIVIMQKWRDGGLIVLTPYAKEKEGIKVSDTTYKLDIR